MLKVTDRDIMSVFDGINDSTLEKMLSKAFKKRINRGEILFAERDEIDKVYMVLDGRVTMYRNSEDGQKRVIYILDNGNFINEVSFDNSPASISCEAFQDSMVLYFLKKDLLEIMSNDFELTKVLINSMSKKIRRLYRQLKNTVPIKMDKKLAAKLWKLAKDYGIEGEEGIIINLNISITYLANMLGSTRETISRCMKSFEKKGLISFKDKKIVVKDQNKLSLYFKGM